MNRITCRRVETDVHALIHGRAGDGKIAIAASALGALALSGQLYAADATPANSSTTPDQPLEAIVVTGIRASLQKSLDIKMQSTGVVDAISAEDIGAFPDASLGEAMQRIPGVTVTRTTMGGTGGPELRFAAGASWHRSIGGRLVRVPCWVRRDAWSSPVYGIAVARPSVA